MAAAADDKFSAWLAKTLTDLNGDVDTDVFVSYISGILDTETDDEEIKESIMGILSEVTEEESKLCDTVLQKWNEFKKENPKTDSQATKMEKQLSDMLEKQKITATTVTRELTAEERERKAAILAQYAQVSSGEYDSDHEDRERGAVATAAAGDSLTRNVNADLVAKEEKDKRETSRLEAERKKQKDKEDREKQKQKQQERKDAEKKRTQKGERRR